MIWQEGFSQYVYGTTGLLHMPTADMQRDKTFLFGASYLDVAATPAHYLNGPAVGVNFHFYLSGTNFFVKALNNLNVMAEYDSRTINCGLKYSFWKDYINAVVEMTECKHLSGGVIFKVHLK